MKIDLCSSVIRVGGGLFKLLLIRTVMANNVAYYMRNAEPIAPYTCIALFPVLFKK